MRSNRTLSLVAFACLSFACLANASPGIPIPDKIEPSAEYIANTNDTVITNNLLFASVGAQVGTEASKDASLGTTSINKSELIACLRGEPTGNVVCPIPVADLFFDFVNGSPGIDVTEYLTASTAQHQDPSRGRRPDTGCERAPRFPHDAAWHVPLAGDVGLRS